MRDKVVYEDVMEVVVVELFDTIDEMLARSSRSPETHWSSTSSCPASVSPLCQPIHCDKHRKVSQPHIWKIEPAVIDQRQTDVAHDSVDTCPT